MKKKTVDMHSEKKGRKSIADAQSQVDTFDMDNSAIVEYFEVLRSEYEIERSKKQSFENRAGLIMALLGTICIFLFEKIRLQDVISLMMEPLTFIEAIEIISGLAVYICFVYTMIMIICTINVKKQSNFEVKNIDEKLLGEQRLIALCRIIYTYRDIIIQHRELNEKRASAFKKSLYGICATLSSVVVYISLL